MRELKFRAWNKFHKRMSRITKVYFDVMIADCECGGSTNHTWGFKDLEIMQYTGLKDKNGVEAFEGDIIQSDNTFLKGVPLVVKFEKGCFIAETDSLQSMRGLASLSDQPFKIIGNLHENPELIK